MFDLRDGDAILVTIGGALAEQDAVERENSYACVPEVDEHRVFVLRFEAREAGHVGHDVGHDVEPLADGTARALPTADFDAAAGAFGVSSTEGKVALVDPSALLNATTSRRRSRVSAP